MAYHQRHNRLPALARLLCLGAFLTLSACSNPLTQTPAPGPLVSSCATHSSTPVTLTLAYTTEKQAWMQAAVAGFNRLQPRACDGPITVRTIAYEGSGQSMQSILDGTITPDIWSPAGNVWLTLLNAQWQQKHSTPIVGNSANENPSLVKSPVVIALWQPMAEALGWPTQPIGWSQIASLSTSGKNWAAYGHPEWGDFKFGHTNPDDSNSGLDAVIAENYAAVHKRRDLNETDVRASATRAFVTGVESSIIHYGESTGTFASEMFTRGVTYLSAAVMYENLVVEANQGQFGHLPYPVVAIYPDEGTFLSDHPFALLHARWVTPAQQAAAQVLRDYLLAPAQQQLALHDGFRPGTGAIAAPITRANGADPAQPSTLLPVPDASVVRAIQASWQTQKRNVDVMLIIDRSGSMSAAAGQISKIEGARMGLAEFINLLGDNDAAGLTAFSDQEQTLSPLSQLGPKRRQILQEINAITPDGQTRLYDTIADQFQQLQRFSSRHIKAIVVLTDGIDDASTLTLTRLLQQVTPTGSNAGAGIKIFTIAYGDPQTVDGRALSQIAALSGGQEYAGSPQNIRQVYLAISTFF